MEMLELYGRVDKEGKFELFNKNRFDEWCRQNKDKNIRIRFDRRSSKRSDPQNRYYWGVVIKEVALRLRELGNIEFTDEDVHELMKLKFNTDHIANQHGEAIEVPKSTTILTKTEFLNYLEKIKQWASGFLEIYIPDPNEDLNLNF